MSMHAFSPQSFGESRLYYRGDAPILELAGNDPCHWGQAHGYILGKEIYQLKSNFDLVLSPVLPSASRLPTVFAEVKKSIPKEYLTELEGITEGYNRWASENKVKDRLTVDDLIRIHLVPDSKHFHVKKMEKSLKSLIPSGLREAASGACTTMLYKDSQKEIIFGRNMDWLPFGEGGAKSLVIVWKEKGIASLNTPGLIGAITGWNRHNLSLAINVCPGHTDTVRGMPAAFYNRMILETTKSTSEAIGQTKKIRPLGPYHLTVADSRGEGSCISFYNNEDGTDCVRNATPDTPLTVLNWRYPEEQGGYFNSAKRNRLLNTYFEEARGKGLDSHRLVANAMKLQPFVNSWILMHSLTLRPQEQQVSLCVGNGYAPSGEFQQLPMNIF